MDYIKKFIKTYGYPPTRKEIARFFDIYENAVQEMLVRLEKNGYLLLEPKIARGLVVLENHGRNLDIMNSKHYFIPHE